MRISEQGAAETVAISRTVNVSPALEKITAKESQATEVSKSGVQVQAPLEDNEEKKAKVQQAVETMNHVLKTTNSSSKFMYHEGLDRYYVTIVDKETEEVLKEIPPRKLLDAYYEMQKMLGMIVDEKI